MTLVFLVTLANWFASVASARADVSTIDNVTAPIVRVNVRSSDVTIRTWNRPSVAVDGDARLSIVRRMTQQPADQNPILIPGAHSNGRLGTARMPAESFVVSTIPPGPRDAVIIRSTPQSPAGPLVVTVPADAVFVIVVARSGNLDVHDYRGGTFVGFTTRGRLALDRVGGTIFAQTGAGPLVVTDSSTERLRARSLRGNITFERCYAQQIEASSVDGSIVYDDGGFGPGLARFESTHGDVAIGTHDAAELGAHVAGDGRVYTNFERGAQISGNRSDTNALVGGGGPVVNATTQTGNVYLYDGSIRARERLPMWQPPLAAIAQFVRRGAPAFDIGLPLPRRTEEREPIPYRTPQARQPHRTTAPRFRR